MKLGQRSRTAEAIAAVRAGHLMHDHPLIFEDPFAIHLTSMFWRIMCKSRLLNWLILRKLLGLSRAGHGQVLARSRYTEEKLEQTIALGIDQYVLLGAGLDSFALRRRDLATVLKVYELDHPASQMTKRKRLSRLHVDFPKNLEFISLDFERETVAEALARSSYSQERPAFFSWLGTTQYLTREAVMGTLKSLAAFTASGSEIVLTYIIPLQLMNHGDQAKVQTAARFFAQLGEPYISYFDPDTFPQEVCALGFELVENLSPSDQKIRYFAARTDDLSPLNAYFLHLRMTQ